MVNVPYSASSFMYKIITRTDSIIRNDGKFKLPFGFIIFINAYLGT